MIIEIDKNKSEDIKLLEKFIASMGNSRDSFRYYISRPVSIINNHLFTIILLNNEEPVGYGHLDKEGNSVWLGIAISELYRGQGQGKVIMEYLIDKADELKIKEVRLSVDKNNLAAIQLYNKYGFVPLFEKENVIFFSRNLVL